METAGNATHRKPWNEYKIVGRKAPFKPTDVWAPRVRLQMKGRVRELALFNLGSDNKMCGCDLVALSVRDVCYGVRLASRAIVMQRIRSARCSSRSRRQPGTPWRRGSGKRL